MNFELCRTIAADHPSLPGHFPDAPLVPGVVILDEVRAALVQWRRDSQLTAIRIVKFLVPLKPDQPLTISLSTSDHIEGEIDFCCRVHDQVIAEGRLELRCGQN